MRRKQPHDNKNIRILSHRVVVMHNCWKPVLNISTNPTIYRDSRYTPNTFRGSLRPQQHEAMLFSDVGAVLGEQQQYVYVSKCIPSNSHVVVSLTDAVVRKQSALLHCTADRNEIEHTINNLVDSYALGYRALSHTVCLVISV